MKTFLELTNFFLPLGHSCLKDGSSSLSGYHAGWFYENNLSCTALGIFCLPLSPSLYNLADHNCHCFLTAQGCGLAQHGSWCNFIQGSDFTSSAVDLQNSL